MNSSSRLSALVGACGAITLSALTVCGQDTGFYVKGDVGGNLTQDTDLKEFFGPVAPGSKVQFDPGFRAGLAGGYQFTDWFATEAELGYMENGIDSITGATRIHDATLYNVPFLINGKLQYPNRTPFTPYIGAGVGFSEAIIDTRRLTISDATGSTTFEGSDADTVFAYQAFAGVRYKLNEQMGLSLEYRYFATGSPTWEADSDGRTASDTMSFGSIQTHVISLAFDFRF